MTLPDLELVGALNVAAGTEGLEFAGACNALAGTEGLEGLGALNAAAGTSGLGLAAVLNVLAGTEGLEAVGAANELARQAVDESSPDESSPDESSPDESSPEESSPAPEPTFEELVLEDQPVAFWMLQEDAEAEDVTDLVGEATGTLGAGVTLGVATGLDAGYTCARLDGTTNGRISVPSVATAYPFTVEAWIKTSQSDWGTIYAEADNTQQDRTLQFGLTGDTGVEGHLSGSVRADTEWAEVVSDVAVDDGEWHHVVAIFEANNTSTDVTFYVDGEAASGGTMNRGFPPGLNAGCIGVLDRSGTDTDFLAADVFGVALYDKVLTPQRIAAHFQAVIPESEE